MMASIDAADPTRRAIPNEGSNPHTAQPSDWCSWGAPARRLVRRSLGGGGRLSEGGTPRSAQIETNLPLCPTPRGVYGRHARLVLTLNPFAPLVALFRQGFRLRQAYRGQDRGHGPPPPPIRACLPPDFRASTQSHVPPPPCLPSPDAPHFTVHRSLDPPRPTASVRDHIPLDSFGEEAQGRPHTGGPCFFDPTRCGRSSTRHQGLRSA
jgi:hypothetical protein